MRTWIKMVPLLFLAAACENKRQQDAAATPPLPVEVSVPEIRSVTLTKDYPGYLSADASIQLVARVSGTLQQILFNAGDRVRKGQTLFVIEPDQYRDAVEQAEANLKTAKASLEYARSNYERMKEAEKSDAVSTIQVLQAAADVKECEAAVSSAEASLSTARLNLSYCYVKSPVDGQVDISVYSVGAYLAGSASPVLMANVYKDDILYSYFNVADNQWLAQQLNDELTRHVLGQVYDVTVQLGTEKPQRWRAILDYLSPNVDTNTGTLLVRAVLQNPNHLLKTGAYVSVTLPYGEVDKGVLIPDASIGTDQLGSYIYVVNDSNKVEYRAITEGQIVDDSLRLVKSGLKAGERYVTKALLKVRNGQTIQPVRAKHSK